MLCQCVNLVKVNLSYKIDKKIDEDTLRCFKKEPSLKVKYFLPCQWFKSAKNFLCQKVQKFWADSDYVGKINNKCLALPKDLQSFCEVQKKCLQIFSIFFYYIWIIQMFQKYKIFQKIQLEVGAIAVTNMPLVLSMHRNSITMWSPKGWKKSRWLFHPLPIGFFWKKILCEILA